MNSMPETSPKSPKSTNSNNSSPAATLSPTTSMSDTSQQDSPEEMEDFLTAPLMGLCPKPLHLMTEEERKNHVLMLRQLQQSAQTFKAELEKKEEEVVKVRKAKGPSKKVTASDIDSLLE